MALKAIAAILRQIGVVLNLLAVGPLRVLFILGYCFTLLGLRKGLDALMLFLFRRVGRTPSRDTSIARKISGPGMSKEFYMSINEEDVYILIRARL